MLNFIDLFAGAGGLSEGFIQASYAPLAHIARMGKAVENDQLVQPKVYSEHEWDSEKIESIKMTLEQLRKLAA